MQLEHINLSGVGFVWDSCTEIRVCLFFWIFFINQYIRNIAEKLTNFVFFFRVDILYINVWLIVKKNKKQKTKQNKKTKKKKKNTRKSHNLIKVTKSLSWGNLV